MDIMKNNVIYIVASPFQFYISLLDFYDNNFSKGNMIFFKYKNDKNDYLSIIKKLNLKNLNFEEFYIDEIAMIRQQRSNFIYKIKKKLEKIIFIYKLYYIYKRSDDFQIKIGDRANFEQILLAKLLGENNIKFLGDGASLVFDKDLKIKMSFINKILFKVFNLPNPNMILTDNYDFFLKESKFIAEFYTKLPIKNEVWLFGQTNYFIKPANYHNYNKYTQEAIKKGKGFDYKQEYFNLLRKIKNKFKDNKIYYFPHRNEIIFDEIKELYEIANFGYFSEILPLMLGYLPNIIIGTSTTIFSYSKINLHLDNKVKLFYFPLTTNINNIYEKYGAVNLLKVMN
jgi:hypothetical protein